MRKNKLPFQFEHRNKTKNTEGWSWKAFVCVLYRQDELKTWIFKKLYLIQPAVGIMDSVAGMIYSKNCALCKLTLFCGTGKN